MSNYPAWDDCPHYKRPEPSPDEPFAYFQWNYGWGIWEQVVADAAGSEGVIAAYVGPSIAASAAIAQPGDSQ